MRADFSESAGTAKVLTKSLAMRLAAEPDGSDVPWEGWTHISDDAAEVLSVIEGDCTFDDLVALSPQAAASLSRISGELSFLSLREISLEVARCLAKHKGGGLYLPSVYALSDEVAEALSQYDGDIILGLTRISAEAAEALLNGNASVNMSMAKEEQGTIVLLFRQANPDYRPRLPWISGPPKESGDYFVMVQENIEAAYYPIELAAVSAEERIWWLKQLGESGQHVEVESRKLAEIICHYPVLDFLDVPVGCADAYVTREISKKRLMSLGHQLPISKDVGRLLPSAKKLRTLEVRLTAVEDVLDSIVSLPSLQKLTLLTESLSVEQCKILMNFRGDLFVRGAESWRGLRKLSDEGAALLAKKQGSIAVDLRDVPESAADLLRSHPQFSELDGDDN